LGGLAAYVYYVQQHKMTRQDLFKEKMKLYNNAVLMAGILAWPLLFQQIVGWDKLEGKMWFAFLWPTLLLMMGLVEISKKESKETAFQKQSEIKSNAHGLINASFAMGILLTIIRNSNNDKAHSQEGAQILMISLMMCIAFLLPFFTKEADSYEGNIVRTGQQSIFHMAIGLFMAGMFVSWKAA
jgi:hypothetical protein